MIQTDERPAEEAHEMRVMSGRGDTKLIWSNANADEAANAQRTFDDLTRKGYAAFRVDRDGERTTAMRTFDPAAEKVILVPPLAGG